MKRFNGPIGIEQGTKILFSDFAHDGAMWSGSGPREVRQRERFKEAFAGLPAVTISISMWDMDHMTNSRVDISAENVTAKGFEIVFRTWGDRGLPGFGPTGSPSARHGTRMTGT